MSAAAEWNQGAVPCADSADVTLACHDHDLAARERLIENYIPLVKAIARRYAYTCEPYEDLVQVGSIGLIKAIDRFEPARGVNLAAFAVPNILGEIRRYLRDVSAPVRLPRRHQEICARIGGTRHSGGSERTRTGRGAASRASARAGFAQRGHRHCQHRRSVRRERGPPFRREQYALAPSARTPGASFPLLRRSQPGRDRATSRALPDAHLARTRVRTCQATSRFRGKIALCGVPEAPTLGEWRLQTPSGKRQPGSPPRSSDSEPRDRSHRTALHRRCPQRGPDPDPFLTGTRRWRARTQGLHVRPRLSLGSRHGPGAAERGAGRGALRPPVRDRRNAGPLG